MHIVLRRHAGLVEQEAVGFFVCVLCVSASLFARKTTTPMMMITISMMFVLLLCTRDDRMETSDRVGLSNRTNGRTGGTHQNPSIVHPGKQ